MSKEKVIHEFRVIETENGYRVEINGDKERLKKAGFPGIIPYLGPRLRFRDWRGRRRWQEPHRPRARQRRRWGNPPVPKQMRRPGEPPFWQGGWGEEMGPDDEDRFV